MKNLETLCDLKQFLDTLNDDQLNQAFKIERPEQAPITKLLCYISEDDILMNMNDSDDWGHRKEYENGQMDSEGDTYEENKANYDVILAKGTVVISAQD